MNGCDNVGWGAKVIRLREINIRWPWLKVVVLLEAALLIGLLGGSFLHGNRDETENAKETEIVAEVGGGQDIGEKTQETEMIMEPKLEKVAEEELKLRRDLTGKKLVALTFDDGPSRATTSRLLDILAEKNVRANFFLIGQMIEGAPELMRREVVEGHTVGSHTMGHVNLGRAAVEVIKEEDAKMQKLFQEVAQTELRLMRPPSGEVNDQVRANIGQPMILWSVDPEDWRNKNMEEVVQRVEGAVFDGAVILLHDIYPSTVDAVGKIIDDLRVDGYEFLTVEELAEVRKVKLEKGKTYREFRP